MRQYQTLPRAFTLIELLVVVTIIVVLLALLTPALDKAIYQAELLQCATTQRVAGNGGVSYAFDNKRRYPYRAELDAGAWAFSEPRYVRMDINSPSALKEADMRPMLRPYMALNEVLNDPFLQLPIEIEDTTSNWIWTATDLWFGFNYTGMARKAKMGNRFSYNALNAEGSTFLVQSSLLVSDVDCVSLTAQTIASHPDADGILVNTRQNEQAVPNPNNPATIASTTQWSSTNGRGRGTLDGNFLYDDLSSLRFKDISTTEWTEGRFVRIGSNNISSNYPNAYRQIPRS